MILDPAEVPTDAVRTFVTSFQYATHFLVVVLLATISAWTSSRGATVADGFSEKTMKPPGG
jgi:hypothetical protein